MTNCERLDCIGHIWIMILKTSQAGNNQLYIQSNFEQIWILKKIKHFTQKRFWQGQKKEWKFKFKQGWTIKLVWWILPELLKRNQIFWLWIWDNSLNGSMKISEKNEGILYFKWLNKKYLMLQVSILGKIFLKND